MSAVDIVSKSLANAFVVSILVLASLIGLTSVFVYNSEDTGIEPTVEINPADEDEVITPGTRGLNGDGNDYVDLYRDVFGDPQILIDNAAPGINDIYVGEPNIAIDIPVESIKPENDMDSDGDDILYNVTVNIDTSSTTYWNTETHTWADASNYIQWDIDTISPTYKEDYANGGNCLLIDGMPANRKYIPWFYDDYGAPGFLDADNDQWADWGEFVEIRDDYKMYDGFQFDVAGNAPVGVYNISVEISYRYQTFQNVSTQRLSGGGDWYDPDNAGPTGTGDLGIFDYYFWEPFNTGGGSVDFAVPGNIDFQKKFYYFESNAAPVGAYWEAIPDLGYPNDEPDWYNQQGGAWDYHSNYDNDGDNAWDDGGTGNLGTVVTTWNNRGINDYTTPFNSYVDRICDQYPYDVYDGNGTWHHSGYEAETVWSTVKTEVEYVEIRVEHGIWTSQAADGCELRPDPSNPYYLKAGDEFKKMYVNINNLDFGNHLTDVYVNLTLDNPEYFSLKHDWAWKDQVNSGGTDNFYYRMDAKNGTPVNRYSGEIELTFTREGVRVYEYLPIEFILYYTPDLLNYGEIPMTTIEISEELSTGEDEIGVEFSITNAGNTILENGVLTMDFSEFKHSGEEYTDPEGGEGTYSPTLEVPYLNYGSGVDPYDLSMNVEIPYHWSLEPGVYKIFLDYEGYYFNDGVLGEPTNYVKVWMKWYDDDSDPDTDMHAYCVIDTNGDEVMDIFTTDETRAVDGIYMYVEVTDFDPNMPCVEITEVSINDGTDTFEQGTITTAKIELTLTNTGESNITDMDCELDLYGYFTGEQYYEGYNPNVENPTYHIAALDINSIATATFNIEGIDKLLPPGTHRLTMKYTYCYDNGSLPSELTMENGEVCFNITVTDAAPNIIPTVSPMTEPIRLGHKMIDINLYVDLANREYYSVSDIEAELTIGGNTPFTSDTGDTTVKNKWTNPAFNHIPALGQNNNNMYFNVNLNPSIQEGTYDMNMTLQVFNDRTMETVTVPTLLEVKIYPKIAVLRITDVSISTGKVTPGKEFTLQLTIQNDGGEAAREIYVEFKEAYVGGDGIIENYETINPTGARYPFSSSVVKGYVAEIQPSSTGSVSFTVVGDLNIYPGVTYFQNIEFQYKDSTGNTHTTTDVAPIKSDNSVTAKFGGESYVWDTDREAWITEEELAAEAIFNYTPFWILAVIIIWLVTLLIVFLFIIRPKYKKEKEGIKPDKEHVPKRPDEEVKEGDEQEIIDYTMPPPTNLEEESTYGPEPGPSPTEPPIPEPIPTPIPEESIDQSEDTTDSELEELEELDEPDDIEPAKPATPAAPSAHAAPAAKAAEDDSDKKLPKKGPKNK